MGSGTETVTPHPNPASPSPTLPANAWLRAHGPNPSFPTRRRRLAARILDSQDGSRLIFFVSTFSFSASLHVLACFARESRPDRRTVFRQWLGGGARGCSEGPGRVMLMNFDFCVFDLI